MFGYTELKKRIGQLECEVRTGHKKIAFVKRVELGEPIFRKNGFPEVNMAFFLFRCLGCGKDIYKREEQLTELEKTCLEGLGISPYSWPRCPQYKPPKGGTGQSSK